MTMTLVSTVTVGAGGAASIEFTSIPQTGTDLLVVLSGRFSGGGSNASLGMFLNTGATNSNDIWLRGSGSAAASSSDSSVKYVYLGEYPGDTATSNTFGSSSIYIPNYTGSTKKSLSIDSVSENNATAAWQYLVAGLDNQTSAVTKITLRNSAEAYNFVQYSTASLYTITKGSGGATVS